MYSNLKSPVVYLVYKRLDLVKKVFEAIACQKPATLYVFSDGPKEVEDVDKVNDVRKFISSNVNWECDLKLYFLEKNLGVYHIWHYVLENVFKSEDRMIYLQEDLLPSQSFFRYCDELLDYYYDDKSIYMIAGTNHLGTYEILNEYSYFFLKKTTTLGFAIWKRTYEMFLTDFEKINHPYYLKNLELNFKKEGKIHWLKQLNGIISGGLKFQEKGEEFDLMGLNPNILYNKLVIVPSCNLIKDIGYHDDSENSSSIRMLPKSMRYSYDYMNFELSFPLVHPPFKLVDELYYKRVNEKYPQPKSLIGIMLIRVERIFRVAFYGGPKMFLSKIKRRIKSYKNY